MLGGLNVPKDCSVATVINSIMVDYADSIRGSDNGSGRGKVRENGKRKDGRGVGGTILPQSLKVGAYDRPNPCRPIFQRE